MKYIFIIAAFNAFFYSVLILQKKPRALHDNILFIWLLYLGFFTGIYTLFSQKLFTDFPDLSAGFISLLMLHGPFLYLYISALVNRKRKLARKSFFHFSPFVLFNIYLLITRFLPDIGGIIRMDHAVTDNGSTFLFNIFLMLTALSGPVYFALSILLFRRLDIQITRNFSHTGNFNLDWLRKLVYTFGVVWTILVLFASIHHVFHLFSWVFCTDGLTLSLSVFIILIGYFGLKQREIFLGYDVNQFDTSEKTEKYASTAIDEQLALVYVQRLKDYMANDKPYLTPELNLSQLANDLKIPAHQLSQVINKNLEQNFFDFINFYRVEEIKKRLADPKYKDYSILGVAFESGFNSKSAFNRVFKKVTGETPSQFKQNLLD